MKKILFPITIILVFGLGFLDHLTGYEVSFSMFYLFPILLLTWFKRIRYGILISFLSAATWLTADLTSGHPYSNYWVLLWNMLMRFIVFVIMVFLLEKLIQELSLVKKLSDLDVLTELNNTRSFIKLASIEKNRSSRFKRPFTIAYLDIDNFKHVNDAFGHAQGDILLQNIGKTIKENLRVYDIPARLGGDEFSIFFPETDKTQAELAVNKIKTCVENTLKGHSDLLTLSIGALVVTKPDYSIEEIIRIADDLMYSVKKASKNGIAYGSLD